MARKTKVASKMCIRCGKILPLGDFNPNREWVSQNYRDIWCKECAVKYCVDKDSIKQYFFQNNRQWQDKIWEPARKKGLLFLSNFEPYLNPHTTTEQRKALEERETAKACLSIMNLINFYKYEEHDFIRESDLDVLGTEAKKEEEEAKEEEKPDLKYSSEWRGYYTDEQIQELDSIYSQYEEDFVLDNVSLRDYAHKVAKASWNVDQAEDRMRRGNGDASEYKELQSIFDSLSKSANFAACRRKPGETSGFGSLGEIIMRVEASGAIDKEKVTFPPDDVDKIIENFRHTLVAVGAEGRL